MARGLIAALQRKHTITLYCGNIQAILVALRDCIFVLLNANRAGSAVPAVGMVRALLLSSFTSELGAGASSACASLLQHVAEACLAACRQGVLAGNRGAWRSRRTWKYLVDKVLVEAVDEVIDAGCCGACFRRSAFSKERLASCAAVFWQIATPAVFAAALSKGDSALPLILTTAATVFCASANLGGRLLREDTVAELAVSDAAERFASAALALGVAAVAPDACARLVTMLAAAFTSSSKDRVTRASALIAGSVCAVLSVVGNIEKS